jgi:hypothetical protein
MMSRSSIVGAWRHIVEAKARRVMATTAARQVNAEWDDLVQEGMISVWQSTERGVDPALVIESRMKDWLRYLREQTSRGSGRKAPYSQVLPLDSFREDAE